MTRKRKFAAIAAASAAVATLTLVSNATAAPSPGAPPTRAPAGDVGVLDCSHGHANNTARVLKGKNTIYLRVGPHKRCASTGVWIHWNEFAYAHCWTLNRSGNIWWWVRKPGTNYQGWIWGGNVTGDSRPGPQEKCSY